MRKRLGFWTVTAVMLMFAGVAFAQSGDSDMQALLMATPMMILSLGIGILMIVCQWKVFVKAGQPGWACIVPIYNIIVLLQVAKKPEWWVILFIVPFVNLVIGIMVLVALAEQFGQGAGFAIGMLLLPVIFWPILAFGDSRYIG
jgi:hypothetical protein